MPRSRKIEDALDELAELRRLPVTPETAARLRDGLAARASVVVARAAKVAGQLELAELVGELDAAFERLMREPVKSDPGCLGKTEIAQALYRIGLGGEAAFLRGIHHVQREPVWGGTQDTAAELRGVCAHGLVRLHSPDVASELAELLADPESQARIGAAHAIAYREDERDAPLLRLKVLSGDAEPEVIGECLSALLAIAPESSLDFARQLDRGDEALASAAAVALGSSRIEGALAILRGWWERTAATSLRRTALVAIAMLRSEPSRDFLLSLVREAPGHDARAALEALSVFRDDAALAARVVEAARTRRDVDLREALAAFMGEPVRERRGRSR